MLRCELQKVVPAVWRKRRNGCKVNDFCGYTERKIEKVNATSLPWGLSAGGLSCRVSQRHWDVAERDDGNIKNVNENTSPIYIGIIHYFCNSVNMFPYTEAQCKHGGTDGSTSCTNYYNYYYFPQCDLVADNGRSKKILTSNPQLRA